MQKFVVFTVLIFSSWINLNVSCFGQNDRFAVQTGQNAGAAGNAGVAGQVHFGNGPLAAGVAATQPVPSSSTADQLAAIRQASFERMKVFGYDGEALLNARLLAANVPQVPIGGSPAPGVAAQPPSIGGLITKILKSNQADAILDLVGANVDTTVTIKRIIGVIKAIAGQEAAGTEAAAVSDAEVNYLQEAANHSKVIEALKRVREKSNKLEETKSQKDEEIKKLEKERDDEILKQDNELAKAEELRKLTEQKKQIEDAIEKVKNQK